jgi:hypothetical protein
MTWRQSRLVSRHDAGYVHLVCYYAENPYKLHYACVPCRVVFKRQPVAVNNFSGPRGTNLWAPGA